jgi:hypothetical protein
MEESRFMRSKGWVIRVAVCFMGVTTILVSGVRGNGPNEQETDPSALYNSACFASLEGRTNEALEHLTRSIEHGFLNFNHLKEGDADLAAVRALPEFSKTISAAMQRRITQLEESVAIGRSNVGDYQFQLAVLCAASGAIDRGKTWLRQSLERGFTDFGRMTNSRELRDVLRDEQTLAAVRSAYDALYAWNETPEQRLWGLMQVWAEVKFNFVYFDQVPELDWDAEVRAMIPRVMSA